MIIPESKKIPRRIVLAILAAVMLAVIAIAAWQTWKKSNGKYLIPSVPYVGIFNHVGKYNVLSNDHDSAITSVLEYWQPGETDLKAVWKAISGEGNTVGDMANFVNGIKGMKAEIKNVKLEDLSSFISPQSRTPLIAFFAIDENQPLGNSYYPARVLIGVNKEEKKIIFHDFWLGNNLEISFDEYGKLLQKTPPSLRNTYLVIQPADLARRLEELKARQTTPYPPRTQTMNETQQVLLDSVLARSPYKEKQYDKAIGYFSKAMAESGFEEFAPLEFKVGVYSKLAVMQLGKNDLAYAQINIQTALDMNHDLDKPRGDWPGMEFGANAPGHLGESTMPYRVQGDIYMATKAFQKAKESYTQALVIRPDNPLASAGLAAAEAALGKK